MKRAFSFLISKKLKLNQKNCLVHQNEQKVNLFCFGLVLKLKKNKVVCFWFGFDEVWFSTKPNPVCFFTLSFSIKAPLVCAVLIIWFLHNLNIIKHT